MRWVLLFFLWAVPARALEIPTGGIVFTEVPATDSAFPGFSGARLMLLRPDGSVTLLMNKFPRQADPEVSFDGKRILFSALRGPDEPWQIFETDDDGSSLLQITHEAADCRSPIYQSKLFVLDADHPWYQISFVRSRDGESNLYSCRPDGSALRQLTYSPGGVADPFLMADGRILFSGRQRERRSLFGVNLDGTDYAIFAGDEGGPVKRMATATSDGLVVFVEPREGEISGAGTLAAVSLRRNLHSYRKLTKPSDGLFLFPSPLPNGELLVSHRPNGARTIFGLSRFNPATGKLSKLHGDPAHHAIQAKVLAQRPEPDGRSSVVDENVPTGQLYGLSVYTTDLLKSSAWPAGSARTLRVLARTQPPRVLGETPLEDDGSFNLQVPANLPLKLQVLGKNANVLRTCSWIWVKNREARGCIGCHEDGERTPDNVFARALQKPQVKLSLPFSATLSDKEKKVLTRWVVEPPEKGAKK